MGRVGEQLAAWYLRDHGLGVIASNVRLASGEIDLLATDGDQRVVVEVRSTTSMIDPVDRVDTGKRRRVHRLAAKMGANRVDFVAIRLDRGSFDVHWLPGPG